MLGWFSSLQPVFYQQAKFLAKILTVSRSVAIIVQAFDCIAPGAIGRYSEGNSFLEIDFPCLCREAQQQCRKKARGRMIMLSSSEHLFRLEHFVIACFGYGD